MEHASSVFSGQAGELVWAEWELGVGEAFQVDRWAEEGKVGYEGSLCAAETERAVEATSFTTDLSFENLALLLN